MTPGPVSRGIASAAGAAFWSVIVVGAAAYGLHSEFGFDVFQAGHWDRLGAGLGRWWRGEQAIGSRSWMFLACLAAGGVFWLASLVAMRKKFAPAALVVAGRIWWVIVGLAGLLGGLAGRSGRAAGAGLQRLKRPGRLRIEVSWGDEAPLGQPVQRVVGPQPAVQAVPVEPTRTKLVLDGDTPSQPQVQAQAQPESTPAQESAPAGTQAPATSEVQPQPVAGLSLAREDDEAETASPVEQSQSTAAFSGAQHTGAAPESTTSRDVQADVGVALAAAGWDVRHDVWVDADFGGGFAPDLFDDDPRGLIPILAMAPLEIRVVVPVSLAGASWTAAAWDSERTGIPQWTSPNGAIACPVASALRLALRFFDHHGAAVQELLGLPVGMILATVLLKDGDVANLEEVEGSWAGAGVEVAHLDVDGALERVFGAKAPSIDDSTSVNPLLIKRIQDDSAQIAKRR